MSRLLTCHVSCGFLSIHPGCAHALERPSFRKSGLSEQRWKLNTECLHWHPLPFSRPFLPPSWGLLSLAICSLTPCLDRFDGHQATFRGRFECTDRFLRTSGCLTKRRSFLTGPSFNHSPPRFSLTLISTSGPSSKSPGWNILLMSTPWWGIPRVFQQSSCFRYRASFFLWCSNSFWCPLFPFQWNRATSGWDF